MEGGEMRGGDDEDEEGKQEDVETGRLGEKWWGGHLERDETWRAVEPVSRVGGSVAEDAGKRPRSVSFKGFEAVSWLVLLWKGRDLEDQAARGVNPWTSAPWRL